VKKIKRRGDDCVPTQNTSLFGNWIQHSSTIMRILLALPENLCITQRLNLTDHMLSAGYDWALPRKVSVYVRFVCLRSVVFQQRIKIQTGTARFLMNKELWKLSPDWTVLGLHCRGSPTIKTERW
jgi:hypothetical protein